MPSARQGGTSGSERRDQAEKAMVSEDVQSSASTAGPGTIAIRDIARPQTNGFILPADTAGSLIFPDSEQVKSAIRELERLVADLQVVPQQGSPRVQGTVVPSQPEEAAPEGDDDWTPIPPASRVVRVKAKVTRVVEGVAP